MWERPSAAKLHVATLLMRRRGTAVRKWLLGGLGLLLLLCGGGVAVVTWLLTGSAVDTVGKVAFDRPLKVPPLAGSDGRRRWHPGLRPHARPGGSDLGHGAATRTWGYNGAYLGPTLRASRGERVRSTSTTGSTSRRPCTGTACTCRRRSTAGRTIRFRPAGSTRPRGRSTSRRRPSGTTRTRTASTERQVYRGLAGLFIVDDERERGLELPREYGVDDIPVIVQDKRLQRRPARAERPSSSATSASSATRSLVNGTRRPVPRRRDRARAAAAAQRLDRAHLRLRFPTTARSRSSRTDGGLLAAPCRPASAPVRRGARRGRGGHAAGRAGGAASSPADSAGSWHGSSGGADTLRRAAAARRGELTPATLRATPAATHATGPGPAVERRHVHDSSWAREINGEHDGHGPRSTRPSGQDTARGVERRQRRRRRTASTSTTCSSRCCRRRRAPPPELGGWKDTMFLPPQSATS